MIARADITGLLLAGGRGQRMGGVDKGLQPFRGRPLAAWSLERLQPQVGAMLINANQHPDDYAALGHPVVADAISGFAGPLAGMHAGLAACTTPWLATVPCDSPFLPGDLVARLAAAIEARPGAQIAIARTQGEPQPVFCLMRADLRVALEDYLRAGGRKIQAWYATLAHTYAEFDEAPEAFVNLNSLGELREAEG